MASEIMLNSEKLRFFKNIIALGLTQGVNYILPLLITPYLLHVLGVEHFGALAFSAALVAYFSIIAEYGFNLSATKQVSISRADKNKVNEIYSAVIYIKLILALVGFVVFNLLVGNNKTLNNYQALHLITYALIFAQAISPGWYFQGVEKMKYITYITIASKVIYAFLIFIFVKRPDDYKLVPAFNAVSMLLVGVAAQFYAVLFLKVKLLKPSFAAMKLQLTEGYHIFISNLAISLYTNSITFLLGYMHGNAAVGIYSAAEKIVFAARGFYAPISQAIYPLMSKKANENHREALGFLFNALKIVGLLTLSLSAVLFIFSFEIVNIFYKGGTNQSAEILKILAPIPFFISVSNMLGIQGLLNFGEKKIYTQAIFATACIGFLMSLVFIFNFHEYGAAIAAVSAEAIIVVIFSTVFFRMKKK